MPEVQRSVATPPLHWLRAFEASARHLSFTNAASELFITQSAVSKQVRHLEEHLNQQLFLRERRGLRLTEAGRNYLPTVVRAFNTLEQGTRTFLGYSTDRNLRIKANYAFATFWLCEHLHEFMDENPDIGFTISTALWEQDFSGSDADIEFHYGKKDWFADHALQLTTEEVFPVCAPETASRLSQPVDLGAERILDLTGISDGWDYWATQVGLGDLEFPNRHYFGTFVLSLNLAKAGHGVTPGHSTLVRTLLDRGELVMPFDLAAPGRDGYFLVRSEVDTPPPQLNRLVDWIQEKFAAYNDSVV